MIYGPYAADWRGTSATATFSLMVDNNSADNLTVVVLDVYDATADRVLARREVHRREFTTAFSYQEFALTASLPNATNHRFETRVYWQDVSYVRVDKVTVETR